MKNNIFNEMSGLDDESVDKITEMFPDMNSGEAERIFRRTMEKIGSSEEFAAGDYVSGIEHVKPRNFWIYGTMAAAVLIAVVTMPMMFSALKRSPDPSPVTEDDTTPPQLMELTTETAVVKTTAVAENLLGQENTETSAAQETAPQTEKTVPETEKTMSAQGSKKPAQTTTAAKKEPVKTGNDNVTVKPGTSTTAAVTSKAAATTTAYPTPENGIRAQMIAEGKLPKDQPRLTLDQAEEIVRSVELQRLAGAEKMDAIFKEFNRIAGSFDLYFGSGIAYYTYYLDDNGDMEILMDYGNYTVEYKNNRYDGGYLLTQQPVSFMNLEELNEAEKKGFTSQYHRRRSILMGELPDDQPRLTIAQVQEILDQMSDEDMKSDYISGESEFIKRLNAIHGKPDESFGSGTYNYCYYLDDYGIETITIDYFDGRPFYENANNGDRQEMYSGR